MNDLTTAREALVAEALGEVSQVVERLASVVPAVDASREALTQASSDLREQLTAFEARMAALTEHAKGVTVRHIAQRTDELARSAGQAQVVAMQAAAVTLFQQELRPALRQLTALLQQRSCLSRIEPWLTHAAAGGLGAALSWAAAAWLWGR